MQIAFGQTSYQDSNVDSNVRYSRQLKLIGTEGQQKLQQATVLIAGIGGLGGTTALYLAAAGIGRLILAHEGNIAAPDLNRQILMDNNKVGQERIQCAVDNLRRFNPEVVIEAYPEKIVYERAKSWVQNADFVVDARYDFPERYELNRLCVNYRKPMVEAAMYGFEISLTTILPGKTACLACMYPNENHPWEPLGFPVLGATSGIAGSLAAIEVIKGITGVGTLYLNRLYRLDTLSFRSYMISLKRNASCPHCAEKEGDSDECFDQGIV